MNLTPTQILIGVGVLAALALVGRLITLFRQSDRIEKTLDYSKMKKWEDDDDWR